MKKKVSIIGGGAAAITLAAFLSNEKFEVSIFERNKAIGRKLLVAGKGGFNLTHSEPVMDLIKRYTPASFLKESLLQFTNDDLRNWLEAIGISTYTGSSKRVYPIKGTKPIEVLQAIQNILNKNQVEIKYNKTWTGWNSKNELVFNENETVKSDYTVFALGGGSWKVTGSDGNWLGVFENKGISTVPFQASNCAFQINWQQKFTEKHAGSPLKNISISCSGITQKGEVVVTQFGMEGNAIYALSPLIREALHKNKKAFVYVDFKPSLSSDIILDKLEKSKSKNTTDALKNDLKLSAVQIALLKTRLTKEEFLNIKTLAQKIKNLPLKITASTQIDEAISTVGGVSLSAIDGNFQIKNLKNTYCIGEMLDWDAPTGGYLLQACFSMGVALAKHLNEE